MTDIEKEITIDDLEETGREVAEIIGLENYIKLTKVYTSDYVYIGSYDRIIGRARNRIIRNECNGINRKKLSQKYKLSRRWIQTITESEESKKYREYRKAKREYMKKNQINMFDEEQTNVN